MTSRARKESGEDLVDEASAIEIRVGQAVECVADRTVKLTCVLNVANVFENGETDVVLQNCGASGRRRIRPVISAFVASEELLMLIQSLGERRGDVREQVLLLVLVLLLLLLIG